MTLTVENLEVRYGRAQVIFGLSFKIGAGRVLALIGRNGAGKSTTLKTLIGLQPAAGGSVRFEGQEILGQESFRIARLGLGYVPEERRIFTELTVAENLEVGRRPPREGAPLWTRERLLEIFPNLAEMLYRPAAQMSGGEQQMLALARTLMGNPSLLLLDEPSEGLAPVIVQQMAAAIAALKREGLTVLLSEQNLAFAKALADDCVVIERGRGVFEGTMDELLADQQLRARVLGV